MGRYFVRFAREDDRNIALASPVFSAAPSEGHQPYASRRDNHLLIADLGPEEVISAREAGARVYEDVLFSVFRQDPFTRGRGPSWAYWEQQAQATATPALDATAGAVLGAAAVAPPAAPPLQLASQTDVMRQIKAPAAWQLTRGAGVTIAIVDTGIAGDMPEFPLPKRSPRSLTFAFNDPWTDVRGHGSMCASAAAATTAAGGRFDGVAPDAQLLSARSTFFSSDIYRIYDQLIDDKVNGLLGPLVISNSYGLYVCNPPGGLPADHPYLDIVREAVANNIVVVFAAGNNHYDVLCRHDPAACTPNTIWAVNSIDEVLTVGTVDAAGRNDRGAHANSSRGPGQWSQYRRKPDVVAPTYGEIVWGSGYQVMEWWGTSGACPQVAGLAALILSVAPNLDPATVGDIIRSTATPLNAAPECVGAGLINCEAAVQRAAAPAPAPRPARGRRGARRA